MWMEEKETKLLAKLIERNQNICCGAGVKEGTILCDVRG